MAMPKEHIQKTIEILTEWNPLGPKAKTITDLDDYKTEAIDILFQLQLRNTNPALIVQEILNQAFKLTLSLDDCADAGKRIQDVIKDTKKF